MTRVQEIEADWENAGCPEGDEAVLLREIERLRAMYQVHYKAREKAEAEVQLLRDTLVMDDSGRPRKLWELLERAEKAEAGLAECRNTSLLRKKGGETWERQAHKAEAGLAQALSTNAEKLEKAEKRIEELKAEIERLRDIQIRDGYTRDVEIRAEKAEAELAQANKRIKELEEALRKIRDAARQLTETGGSTLYPDAKTLKNRLDGFVQSILDEVEIALQGEEE